MGAQFPLDPTAGAGCLLSALGHFCSWKLVKLSRTDALRMPGGASAGLCVAPQRPQVLTRDVFPTPPPTAQLLKGCDGRAPSTSGPGSWPRHTRHRRAVPSGHARCAITAPGRRRVLAAQSPAPLAQLITRRQGTRVGGEEMEGNDFSKFVLDADAGREPSVPSEWMSGTQRDGPDR